MDRKEKKTTNVRTSGKKDIKPPVPRYRTAKSRVNIEESKDSVIEKLKCQNKVKDVSIDILSKDIMERNKRLKTLKFELDDKEDEIEFLNIVIVDKDNKIDRLQEEILLKTSHVEAIKARLSDQFTADELLDIFEEEHPPPKDIIHNISERARSPNVNPRCERFKGYKKQHESVNNRQARDASNDVENIEDTNVRAINLLSADYQPRRRREKTKE